MVYLLGGMPHAAKASTVGRDGEGSRFSHIPTPRLLVDRDARASTIEQTTWGGGDKGLLGFVHVVDDDASFRKAIERQLKQAGYEVATSLRRSICWTTCRAKVCQAAFSSTCGYRN